MPEVIRVPLGMVSAFLVKGEKTILVDTGIPWTTARIRGVMDAHGIKPTDVSLIVLTHGHLDHAGGAGAARAMTRARIAMHRGCASTLRQGHRPVAFPRTAAAWAADKLFGWMMTVAPVEPDIVIDDELDLRPFGVEGRVVSTPGHTCGCVSVLLPDGQAIVGDLLTGLAGGSRAELPLFLWDLDSWRRSLGRILEAAPSVVHNAHGPACTLDACRALARSVQ